MLLLDDTYVSGARAQSAAAALRLGGARSVLIVPLGRVIRPERFASHAAFMEERPGGKSGGSFGGEGHRPRCLLVQDGHGSDGHGSDGRRQRIVHVGQLLGNLPQTRRIGAVLGPAVGVYHRGRSEELRHVGRADELAGSHFG